MSQVGAMRLACIGWGSLIWNPGVLRCVGDWRTDGPELPLEYARTSHDGRLTLVLVSGTELVPALWTELNYPSAEEAQAALAGREGSDLHAIGLWPGKSPRHAVGSPSIAAWAKSAGVDAVVWTALRPRFNGVNGQAPDSASQVLDYLRSLDESSSDRAKEYVIRTPVQIRTRFRAAFEAELDWRPFTS